MEKNSVSKMTIALRGDAGLSLLNGPSLSSSCMDDTKNCRVMAFSSDGLRLAYADGTCVKVCWLEEEKTKSLDASGRIQFLSWSPLNTHLSTWEVFAVRNNEPQANCKIWHVESGTCIYSCVQRKSEGWHPRWSLDETRCVLRGTNNEVLFFTNLRFDAAADKKLSLAKLNSFSVNAKATHVVCFVPATNKGSPGFAKLFRYPDFHPEKDVVASKSFMLADKMDTHWSPDSKAVLLLMQSEVDKTGASYYGKTQLNYMDVLGETATMQLSKEGPIYHVSWRPNGASLFCVVYGFMPAKATLFNKKCDKVFDFGTGPRNIGLFNGQGSLLMLGGFGNLRGNIEVWDVEAKKAVANFEAPDSTDVKWAPDGQHILTSTCAPRLRQGNGYKVWHYTSTLMHETAYNELWEATWRPQKELEQQFSVLSRPITGGVTPSQPKASKMAYVPPAARGKVNKSGVYNKLHDEDELPENVKKAGEENLSKAAAKNKKRREAAKKKKGEEEEEEENCNRQHEGQKNSSKEDGLKMTGDPEKDKKMRKLNEKLVQIKKLKQQVAEGKSLEANQLDKIKREQEIVQEMNQLRL